MLNPAYFRKRSDSKEMQPVHVRLLCRLQLSDCHAYKSNRVSGVHHDYRARLGVMHLIPSPIDQNRWAHWRNPMDMIRQG